MEEAIREGERGGKKPALLRPGGVLAALGVLLLASNLRAPITVVGPVLGDIQASIGLSAAVGGLLTSLPLLAFAALSPFAPALGRRFGLERVLFGALVLLAGGLALRSAAMSAALFSGTVVVGAAIALGNVLLPALIKRDFPAHAGLMTGLYTATMSSAAALASGVSVPLASVGGVGWRGVLVCWAALSLLAALVWAPRIVSAPPGASAASARQGSYPAVFGGLWRSPLAWQVTLFMGLQSVVFYVSVTWLPDIVRDGGLDPAQAGWMVSVMQLVSIPAALVAPILAERASSQRLLLAAAAGSSAAGILGLLISGGSGALAWVVLLGIGQGACISLALTLFALRAPDPSRASDLSSMAQSLGYLISAAGPSLFGALHDLSRSWSVPLAALLTVTAALAAVGFLAGRDAEVEPADRPGETAR